MPQTHRDLDRLRYPVSLAEARLPSEKMLEEMIVAAPRVISDEWMLIGRQGLCSW
jgi:hypothetical protein